MKKIWKDKNNAIETKESLCTTSTASPNKTFSPCSKIFMKRMSTQNSF